MWTSTFGYWCSKKSLPLSKGKLEEEKLQQNRNQLQLDFYSPVSFRVFVVIRVNKHAILRRRAKIIRVGFMEHVSKSLTSITFVFVYRITRVKRVERVWAVKLMFAIMEEHVNN